MVRVSCFGHVIYKFESYTRLYYKLITKKYKDTYSNNIFNNRDML